MATAINDLLGFVDAYVKETEGMPAHECPERDVMKDLAAAYRELTTLRPMTQAPPDDCFVLVWHTNSNKFVPLSFVRDEDYPEDTGWYDTSGFAVLEGGYKGWLPLPEVKA